MLCALHDFSLFFIIVIRGLGWSVRNATPKEDCELLRATSIALWFCNVSSFNVESCTHLSSNIVFLCVKMSTNGAFRPRTQAAICKPEMDNGVLHPWSQKVFHAYQGTQLRICIALEAKTHTHTRT